MAGDIVLEMRGISKAYPGVKALDDVSLTVYKGEVHALMGENGAGKSTLMRILAGAEQRDAGEIFIDGQPITIESPFDALRQGITVIYQELSLSPHLSAAENLFMGRHPRKRSGLVDYQEMNRQAGAVIRDLGMDFDPRTPVRDLRIAEQQVVEIAKSRISNAKVLVLDEPSAVLGRQDVENLFRLIRKLQADGVAIIFISHRLDEVFEISDRVTVLKDGKYVATRPLKELDSAGLIRLMTGRDVKDFRAESQADLSTRPIALSVRNLSRKGVFEDVNFEIRQGEILGFAGLVGSGRTEIARAIFGADSKDSGEIEVFGRPIKIKSPHDAVKAGIGLIPENRKEQGLLLGQAISDNITLPRLKAYTRRGLINFRRIVASAERMKDDLSIKTPSVKRLAKFLSGGNQQKVVFAKWLDAQCKVLIVDEPTRGVDVGAKREMYALLDDLRKEGAAILMISSDTSEILGLCDRVLVIKQGRIAEEFTRSEMDDNPSIIETMVEAGSAT